MEPSSNSSPLPSFSPSCSCPPPPAQPPPPPPSPSSSSSSSSYTPSSPSVLPSPSFSLNQEYDVFLNFRGEDVGKGFLSHLSHALRENGVVTYKENQLLDRGEDMGQQFLNAIERSSCSVVVLSKHYAFSTWCLEELVKIMECHQRIGQKIYPIYYDVDSSEVLKQKGSFGEAFARHEQVSEPDNILRWKDALLRVSGFPGWSLVNRDEATIIKEIVSKIIKFLASRAHSIIDDDFIGFDKHLKILEEKMCLESENVRFIGICGRSGIGKTALARRIYDFMSSRFEHRSFLADVAEQSEKGNLVYLQTQLLSQTLMNKTVNNLWNVYNGANMIGRKLRHKRCFIVIDDVDDDDQLSYLAKRYDWFGPGSRIIITSRDRYLLKRCGVETNSIYQPQELNQDEALRLVSMKAFGRNNPPKDLIDLCKCIVEHSSGLPLALEVFGSVLNGRSSNECMLLARNVKGMGRRILEEPSSSKPGKGRRFWRHELSRLFIPGTECTIDMHPSQNEWTQKIDMEWIFTMTNFSMELSSAVFDQLASQRKPHLALIATIMSFAGAFLSALELVYKARKEKIVWSSSGRMPWFYYPSPMDNVRFGSFADFIGLVCAICQSIVVAINYVFVVSYASSPIKISVWPIVFAFVVVLSKVLEARGKVRTLEGRSSLHPKES